MSIYPTLCDLADVPVPEHVEGRSIHGLLQNPQADYDGVAVTTFGQNNHAVRTDRWRYIRYADGGEELYDHDVDTYEWTNLATLPEHAALKKELAAHFPEKNVNGVPSDKGKQSGDADQKKKAGKKNRKQKAVLKASKSDAEE